MTPVEVLRTYFGYEQFRPGQADIINSVLRGVDTLAILPTGGGKSLCYQVPGLLLPGVTIVVSPLISLMQDQVSALERRGISATVVNSSLSPEEQRKRVSQLESGVFKFVYVSPERLQNTAFVSAVSQIKVSLVAVDEAHCISMWGHDFRPEYRLIATSIQKLHSKPKLMALTATATPVVKQDIIEVLGFESYKVFQKSFARTNLRLWSHVCHSRQNQQIQLLRLLHRHRGQSGIIYTLTRKKAEQTVAVLKKMIPELSLAFYHGGMEASERQNVQNAFIHNEMQLIVATNAFGMGVDKPSVRFVIHLELPSSIENYYQEAGRGGRDGLLADCYVLFYEPLLKVNLSFLQQTSKNRQQLELQKLQAMVAYSLLKSCRTKYILKYFGEESNANCGNCDNCLGFSIQPLRAERKRKCEIERQVLKTARLLRSHPRFVMTQTQLELSSLLASENWSSIPGLGAGWQRIVEPCFVKPGLEPFIRHSSPKTHRHVPALLQPAASA